MSLSGIPGVQMLLGSQLFDIADNLQKFVWFESLIDGGFSWRVRVSLRNWAVWNKVAIGLLAPQFRLSLTVTGGDQLTTDWRYGVVNGASVVGKGFANTIEIRGADRRLDMLQKERTRAWPLTSASDVARAVAGEYGFVPVVEDTEDRRDRWQVRETDWGFLCRTVNAAALPSGRGDVFVWVDNNLLFLNAPELQRKADRAYRLSPPDGTFKKYVASYNGRDVDRAGGATLDGIGYDLRSKVAVPFTFDRTAASAHPALGKLIPREQTSGYRVRPISRGARNLVEHETRGEWGKVGPRYISLRLDAHSDLTLRPGMVLELRSDRKDQFSSPFSGRYSVLEVQHVMTPGVPDNPDTGGIETTAVCFRREATIGIEEPSGAVATAVGSTDPTRVYGGNRPRSVIVAEVLDAL